MNAPGGLGLITRGGILDISAKMDAILTDPDTRSAVSVVITSVQTYNAAAGTTAETQTTSAVDGYQGPLATAQIREPYQVGDVVLLIMAADVTGSLDAAATWATGGAVYRVISATIDALGLHWRLIGRRTT